MNTKSWMLLIFFLFASLLQLVAETSSLTGVLGKKMRAECSPTRVKKAYMAP